MAGTATSNYTACTKCKALNMKHRSTCYKCGAALPVEKSAFAKAGQEDRHRQFSPMTRNTRRTPRYEVRLPEPVYEICAGYLQPLEIRDFSTSGLAAYLEVPRRAGSNVRLQVTLAGKVYTLQGVIRHCERCLTKPGFDYVAGVEFSQLDPAVRRLLELVLPQ